MLVYIAGAGAMGCRFGYQLSKTENEVILLDNWSAHIEAIRQDGLLITGDVEDRVQLPIMLPTEATRQADLIILLTKADQLPKMLQDIKPIIGKETKVLSLLNGLGHATTMRRFVPEENIMVGVTIWLAGLKGPGHAHLEGTGSISLQDLTGQVAAVAPIVEMFNQAGLKAQYDENVIQAIWQKACVNGTMNPTCTILDCTIGELFGTESGLNLVQGIFKEFIAVAKAEVGNIDEEGIWKYIMDASKKAASHYPSMHQDLVQHGRKTEIDFLNGAVVFKGKRVGIPTPYCQMVTDMIHTKESILGLR
ncbi:2-dehydropantoate 2-reductase [Streptococcus suis]|uniref:2-dehydropantoate 2-reductase n=1 Tax=Streptococcus suivaginalis TaxID=3028082 RepID=A0AA96VCD6_9STRE|nr:2-dehydropantoate 2-reductase [Streptococcus sp. 29896]MCK4027242.1 2-dehydropantoate 2-reductase [Streptococcus suis]WNY46587.1 2-dehydropantoate 2-reductase [Streptococcus sp. 29896]